ncbi:MAG: RNA polymerase sigma factor RpoD, partial [Clostridia bacterium]|nr:RNA polymerase sigma factor RpoD [Clostridia bacterium]
MTNEEKLQPMEKVDELIERGKTKGELTYKEVIDTLGGDLLDVDQMEVVYDRFEDANIDVVEEVDQNELASDEVVEISPKLAASEGIAIDDPVRMYL